MKELLYIPHLVNIHQNTQMILIVNYWIPDFEFFDKEQRSCFIIEDCDVKALGKQ